MCDNPLCDICHAEAAPPKDPEPRQAGGGTANAAPRRILLDVISGLGVIALFAGVMVGATALRLSHVLPALPLSH